MMKKTVVVTITLFALGFVLAFYPRQALVAGLIIGAILVWILAGLQFHRTCSPTLRKVLRKRGVKLARGATEEDMEKALLELPPPEDPFPISYEKEKSGDLHQLIEVWTSDDPMHIASVLQIKGESDPSLDSNFDLLLAMTNGERSKYRRNLARLRRFFHELEEPPCKTTIGF